MERFQNEELQYVVNDYYDVNYQISITTVPSSNLSLGETLLNLIPFTLTLKTVLKHGAMRVMAANNDTQIRIYDAETFANVNRYTFDCGLKGHLDYSFASDWHPDGHILATGNQDTSCRLWDIRNLSKSLAILKGRMAAIRGVKFASDGQFLARAEPADFVHVFNTKSGYVNCQEIDIFGEIAGISFSPDTEALFVGVTDRTYGSLLEFIRRRDNHYLDSML
ncbi:ethylene-responsive transcription factor RAP2-4-like isoform 1 [Hibiscus syriacus]|uniref:Ethylene-responsive transcription factor RAP2-4-like isoform 1 n=1 Tax=Hibiscus syriacus TaxID=106335 RepID=A0A6A2WDA1_HIBSY|nr:ethylene-responsive transcription factor RAP2-4-like isoform 1 [Hibiscus syriacus]